MQSEEGQKKIAMNFCVSHFRTEMEVWLVAEGARDPLEQMQSRLPSRPPRCLIAHALSRTWGGGRAGWGGVDRKRECMLQLFCGWRHTRG